MVNLHPQTPHIMPSYTYKMASVSCFLWRQVVLCIGLLLNFRKKDNLFSTVLGKSAAKIVDREYTIRYDTRCYFNVRSKADMSRLNLLHGKYACDRPLITTDDENCFVFFRGRSRPTNIDNISGERMKARWTSTVRSRPRSRPWVDGGSV